MPVPVPTVVDIIAAEPRMTDLIAAADQIAQTMPEDRRMDDGFYGRGGIKDQLGNLVGENRNLDQYTAPSNDPHGISGLLRRRELRDTVEEAEGTLWLCGSDAWDVAYHHLVAVTCGLQPQG